MTGTIGALFAGYGGLELAVEHVTGYRTAWCSEIDPHAARIHAAHWPDVPNLGDITTVDWSTVEPVDVICGGFPCQDISTAGRGAGIHEGTRSGLWFTMLDAVRVVRPRLVVVENVRALLVRGFGTVVDGLAGCGYDCRWVCVPASAAGAPHRRERLFLAATDTMREGRERAGHWVRPTWGGEPTTAGTDGDGFDRVPGSPTGRHEIPGHVGVDADERRAGSGRDRSVADRWGPYTAAITRWEHITGRPAPDPTIGGRLNPQLSEWMMGLPPGWITGHGLPRGAELRLAGNGVVPQQAVLALEWLLDDQGWQP